MKLVTNLNGLFSKISLRIHQTYTKEKCFLQHGFSENGGVQTFDSLKQFEWNRKTAFNRLFYFTTSYHLWPFVFFSEGNRLILNHAINSLSVKDNRKVKTGGKKVTFQNVNFLNHWLQNTRSSRKKKFFPENTIFKGIIFW